METIYSLVTKPINQNIAVIRISGDNAFLVVNKLIDKNLDEKKIQIRNIIDKKKKKLIK